MAEARVDMIYKPSLCSEKDLEGIHAPVEGVPVGEGQV